MVGVLDTENNFALGMATADLGDAGIIYDVVEVPAVPALLKRPTWWILPCRIMVAVEDADETRSLIEPYQQPATRWRK